MILVSKEFAQDTFESTIIFQSVFFSQAVLQKNEGGKKRLHK